MTNSSNNRRGLGRERTLKAFHKTSSEPLEVKNSRKYWSLEANCCRIPLNREVFIVSHNLDFAIYPRTGVSWQGGLLHSVSGVSYWTLRAGIVGHLRPCALIGRYSDARIFSRANHCLT